MSVDPLSLSPMTVVKDCETALKGSLLNICVNVAIKPSDVKRVKSSDYLSKLFRTHCW